MSRLVGTRVQGHLAWITRRIDIARWWHEHHASFPV